MARPLTARKSTADIVNLNCLKEQDRADFKYQDSRSGELIVEDTKGVRTKDYIIKRKLMLSVYGIKIREIWGGFGLPFLMVCRGGYFYRKNVLKYFYKLEGRSFLWIGKK